MRQTISCSLINVGSDNHPIKYLEPLCITLYNLSYSLQCKYWEKYLEGRGRSFNELLFYFSSYPFSIAELDVISCKITIKSLRMKKYREQTFCRSIRVTFHIWSKNFFLVLNWYCLVKLKFPMSNIETVYEKYSAFLIFKLSCEMS